MAGSERVQQCCCISWAQAGLNGALLYVALFSVFNNGYLRVSLAPPLVPWILWEFSRLLPDLPERVRKWHE